MLKKKLFLFLFLNRGVQNYIFYLRPGFGDKKICDLIKQNKI